MLVVRILGFPEINFPSCRRRWLQRGQSRVYFVSYQWIYMYVLNFRTLAPTQTQIVASCNIQ